MFLSETFRGLRPRTPKVLGLPGPVPGYFLCGQKVTKKPHGREKPFRWGFSPVAPSSATTQRGRPPSFGNPRITSSCPA